MSNKKRRGFTLSEVLVVVLIVAILVAIAYPLYTRAITKSRAAEAVNLLQIVRAKQIQEYARHRKYFEDFSKMGQVTGTPSKESAQGAVLTVGDYKVALNSAKKCLTASYEKKGTSFAFSAGYEEPGLGCSSSSGICQSFGDIVGQADSVCNCQGVSCGSNYALNPATCACECPADWCTSGSGCFPPYGGGTQVESCPNGTKVLTCTSSCYGATCQDYDSVPCDCNPGFHLESGSCVPDTVDCPQATKPAPTKVCGGGNGTITCAPTCNTATGTWQENCGTCACNAGYHLEGSNCVKDPVECPQATKPAATKACDGGNGTITCAPTCNTATGTWQENCGTCACNAGYHLEGALCVADRVKCPATCASGARNPAVEYEDEGACCMVWECTPGSVQPCGTKCGMQACNVQGQWEACQDNPAAVCSPGEEGCSASCTCAAGYTFKMGYGCLNNNDYCFDVSCPDENEAGIDLLFPDPNNIGCFCKCDWGLALRNCCPDGLEFCPETSVCEWPGQCGAGGYGWTYIGGESTFPALCYDGHCDITGGVSSCGKCTAAKAGQFCTQCVISKYKDCEGPTKKCFCGTRGWVSSYSLQTYRCDPK